MQASGLADRPDQTSASCFVPREVTPQHRSSKSNVFPPTWDAAGAIPLIMAAQFGYTDIVRMLLAAGTTPGTAAEDGYTALHNAAEGGLTEIAQLMIAHTVPLDAALFDTDDTPLHLAVKGKHPAMVQLLLDAGAAAYALGSDDCWPQCTVHGCSRRPHAHHRVHAAALLA
jgi:ankyrin repeat protein